MKDISDFKDIMILVVDDVELNRIVLSDFIKTMGCSVIQAADGVECMNILKNKTPDAILLDIMMPNKNGYEVLDELMADKKLMNIPVLVITALDDFENSIKCIEKGAEDFLPKPFNRILLKARLKSAIAKKRAKDLELKYAENIRNFNFELRRKVKEQVSETKDAQRGMIMALSKLAEYRDNETGMHLNRLTEYSRIICDDLIENNEYTNEVDEKFKEILTLAAPIHDAGKVGIPDKILLKPGKLTDEEFEIMKQHAVIGANALEEVLKLYPGNSYIELGIKIAKYHHEKWDGSGYPEGLSGEDIPVSARIIALADVFDALSTKRCYKEAFPFEKCRQIILESKGSHFDPRIVDSFERKLENFKQVMDDFKDEK